MPISLLDMISGKIPSLEDFSLLETKCTNSVMDLVKTVNEQKKNIEHLSDKITALSELLKALEKQIAVDKKSIGGELEKLSEICSSISTDVNRNKCVEPTRNFDSKLIASVPPTSSERVLERPSVVTRVFYSGCSQNGFSSSSRLFDVDESHGSAYYVIIDDGNSECSFYPIVSKSDMLLMNMPFMLTPVCDIDSDGSGIMKVIEPGRVCRSGSSWSIMNKCKIVF